MNNDILYPSIQIKPRGYAEVSKKKQAFKLKPNNCELTESKYMEILQNIQIMIQTDTHQLSNKT